MNAFGEFLYTLRKEKGMTQAELAAKLGVTNKAVSKWETGEAMPETSLLLPISEIFGVTVDELLNGKRAAKSRVDGEEINEENADASHIGDEEAGGNAPHINIDLPHINIDLDGIKNHLSVRGKDDGEPETAIDRICGIVCAVVFLCGLTAYLFLGAFTELWHPYWVILPACALGCGVIGIIFDLCNREKREYRIAKGKNPYTDAACGFIMLICIISYLLVGALANLWHPCWVIIVGGVVADGIIGSIGNYFAYKNSRERNDGGIV